MYIEAMCVYVCVYLAREEAKIADNLIILSSIVLQIALRAPKEFYVNVCLDMNV